MSDIKLERIEEFISENNYNLATRTSALETSRFIDQKCTPSIVRDICFIIIDFLNIKGENSFTIKEIWEYPISAEIFVNQYGKGNPLDKSFKNEYDKIFSEPILQLTVAKILQRTERAKTKGRPFLYKVKNLELIELLAYDQQLVLEFQYHFYKKVINDTDSDLLNKLHNYIDLNHIPINKDDIAKKELEFRALFGKFIKDYTNVNREYEWKRMYLKFINTLAVKERIYGRANGTISEYIPNHEEGVYEMTLLDYSRSNWYDDLLEKDKKISRSSGAELFKQKLAKQKQFVTNVNKAIKQIKDLHSKSEIDESEADHVHHIFPRSKFAKYADQIENLILLSGTQHCTAHRVDGVLNYAKINLDFQIDLLKQKAKSIKRLDADYCKNKFITIIEECYNEENKKQLIDEIKTILDE